jgi:hypothetical protein
MEFHWKRMLSTSLGSRRIFLIFDRGGSRDVACFFLAVGLLMAGLGFGREASSIPVNRRLDVLSGSLRKSSHRCLVLSAGRLLKDWQVTLSDVTFDGKTLVDLTQSARDEPFTRVLREGLKRPIDPRDFILFLDDLLLAGKKGLRGQTIWITPGRARRQGIQVHPDDVFRKNQPRRYAEKVKTLAIDKPPRQADLPVARDGDPLGPSWTVRYRHPCGEKQMLDALAKARPASDFSLRVRSLINQLREQGAEVAVWSTIRNRKRGYLMWGAFRLGRAKTRKEALFLVRKLKKANRAWNLNIPIRWLHPQGLRATVKAARQMADAYGVVYATRKGARFSSHYDGFAIDMTAYNLPRTLHLTGKDGRAETFDLSQPNQSRDLSLSPQLITWIEKHFQLEKLLFDHPHWNDKKQK